MYGKCMVNIPYMEYMGFFHQLCDQGVQKFQVTTNNGYSTNTWICCLEKPFQRDSAKWWWKNGDLQHVTESKESP